MGSIWPKMDGASQTICQEPLVAARASSRDESQERGMNAQNPPSARNSDHDGSTDPRPRIAKSKELHVEGR